MKYVIIQPTWFFLDLHHEPIWFSIEIIHWCKMCFLLDVGFQYGIAKKKKSVFVSLYTLETIYVYLFT